LNPIDPAILQVDAIPLVPKLRKNRTAHIDYLYTLKEAATLRELVESERLLRTKPVAVTPKNKNQQIRSTPQITKSAKPSVETSTSLNIDSNTPVLSSTGVALASSASESKSKDNTKNNRIRRSLKKAKETKLEDHPRKVKSSLHKASVVDTRTSSSEIKIATAPLAPRREPIPLVQNTDKPVVTLVYTRKPRAKHVPNKMEPNKSWGSSSNVSTSITNCRSGSAYRLSGKQPVYSVLTRHDGVLPNLSLV
nr:hypothetical protein [Tanacetum cinerariifolium]